MTQEKNSILHSTKSPKIEERGFIFIDLNDSTYISKKLSPVSYSQFISVCFKILEQRLIDSPFSIYQFVGDEAVLTWRNNTDENHYEAGIKLVFEFNIALRELYPFFIESFGVVPVFKSSIHWGSVAKTTIGELRPEVAYHGEILNVSAKMLLLAKKHMCSLVISDEIYKQLNYKNLPYRYKPLGSIYLHQNHPLFLWQITLPKRLEKFLIINDY